ncbi:ATP-binding protein [Streptomyces sp. NPDC055709]
MTVQEIPSLTWREYDESHSPWWELGNSAAASGRARSLVNVWLRERGLGELTDTALIITSELVTNAVIHAASPQGATLSLRLVGCPTGGCCVWVLVRDHGSRTARAAFAGCRGHVRDPMACSGRGLDLVDHLAEAWGDAADDRGHTVWACLRCDCGCHRQPLRSAVPQGSLPAQAAANGRLRPARHNVEPTPQPVLSHKEAGDESPAGAG